MVRLQFEVGVIVGEVVRQFVDQVSANLELLVKLIDLLDSFLVGSKSPIDLTKLRTEITENVRKDSNSKDNDEQSPNKLIVVNGQYVSISNSCTSDRGPVHRGHIPREPR